MTDRDTIFQKTAKTGQQIEVQAYEMTAGTWVAQLYIDGKYVTGPARPQPLKQPKGEITHYLGGGFTGGKQAVGLTSAEADAINEALDARVAAWRESEAGQAYASELKRKRLVAEYMGALDEQEAAYERAHVSDGSAAWEARKAAQARVDEALANLKALKAKA